MHLVEMLFTTNRDVSKRTLDHKNRIHFLFTTNRDVPITFWSQKSGPFFGPRPRFRWFKIVHFCLKIYMVNENNPMGYPMLSLLKKLAIYCYISLYMPVRGLQSGLNHHRRQDTPSAASPSHQEVCFASRDVSAHSEGLCLTYIAIYSHIPIM